MIVNLDCQFNCVGTWLSDEQSTHLGASGCDYNNVSRGAWHLGQWRLPKYRWHCLIGLKPGWNKNKRRGNQSVLTSWILLKQVNILLPHPCNTPRTSASLVFASGLIQVTLQGVCGSISSNWGCIPGLSCSGVSSFMDWIPARSSGSHAYRQPFWD